MHDAIVIGGGLSGAVFAHHFAKKGRVLIIERENRLGGAIHTVRPFGGDSGFFAELGAHTIYHSYKTIIDIIDELFPFSAVIPHKNPGYFIKYNGRMHSLYSQVSLLGLISGVLKLPFSTKEGKSVKAFYSIFGKNYERVIEPALSAIICQDSSEMAAELVMKSRKVKRKDYPRAFTLIGGLSALIDKIAVQNNVSVNLSARAEKILRDSEGYTVITAEGAEFKGKHLAIATDAHEAARLLPDISKEAGEILKSIPTVFSKAFLFSAKKNDYTFPPFGYIISRDGDFRGAVSRDQVWDQDYRAATLHFLDGNSPEEEFTRLKPLFKIPAQADIYTQTERFSLPRLLADHKLRAEKLEKLLKDIRNLHVLGNYFAGLSMEDCAARGAFEALNV
ncbi:MAG: FAD-dependent oxidoreductase [Deferribacteraceae bacterium]|jgi:protoporphyrinogen oxidase|nr:FAD-dependent oxidoreductase [Deferribacteraceae bacterium]